MSAREPEATEVDALWSLDELEDEVVRLRNRSENVLERVLALPGPARRQRSDVVAVEPPQPTKTAESPAKKGPLKAESSAPSVFFEEPMAAIPDAMERMEARLGLLIEQLRRVTQRNARLKGQIRAVHAKIARCTLDEDSLRGSVERNLRRRFKALTDGFLV